MLYSQSSRGYFDAGLAAKKSGRLDEADRQFAEGMARYPDDASLAIEHALVADAKAHWPEALQRWRSIEARFPGQPGGALGVGRVLAKLGRLDEADDRLTALVKSFPTLEAIAIAHAQVAAARNDWPEALRRWQALRERYPDHPEVISEHGKALWRFQIDQIDQTSGSERAQSFSRPARIETLHDHTARELLLNFESVGTDCEFGLLQRRYGAEPLGLLRWATTFPATLVALLERRFDGLGNPEHLRLTVTPWREYFVGDTRYGLGFHTFINENEIDAATLLRKQSSRIKWLRDRLLEELSDGGKLFVLKLDTPVAGSLLDGIRAAMRQYGRNTLLVVQPDSGADRCGTVEHGGEGLLLGYLDRVGRTRLANGDQVWDISFDAWLAVCRAALRRARPQLV